MPLREFMPVFLSPVMEVPADAGRNGKYECQLMLGGGKATTPPIGGRAEWDRGLEFAGG